jgi:hypothetical protein
VRAFADYYLGKAHREDLECGCAMAALTPDVVRAGEDIQGAFEKKMIAIADSVARGLDASAGEDVRARAWAMLGVLIGGVNIVRAMKNPAAVEEVAAAIKVAAIAAAGPARALSDAG